MAGQRRALIVASSNYQDPGLQRLRAPATDAQALAGVLGDPRIGGFDVRTSLDEPAHVISEAVEELFADRARDDLLLVHFSCHGVKDESGELYFAAANTKLRRLGATAVAADFVNRRMNRSRSRRIVLLLDCCYAGAFERGMTARASGGVDIEEQLGGQGRAVITASSAMEYAFEGDELADARAPAPSVFTSALVAGLATGEADRDQDGLIALDELYDYVYDKVRAATPHQTPGKWTFGVQGDLYIARRSRPVTTPTPLPGDLRTMIDHPLAGIRGGAVQELHRLLQGSHAGLALGAKLALERLARDDSRAVSAAAVAALGTDAAAEPAPPETRPAVVPAAPIHERPIHERPIHERPIHERPIHERPSQERPGPPAEAPAGVDGEGARRARADPVPLRRVAGELALLGAGLLLVGLFPAYQYDASLVAAEPDVVWYAVIVAVIVGTAGVCTLLPRTGRLIGPGLLLGTAAASTWGLATFASAPLGQDGLTGGLWVELAAHVVLVLAGCLAGLALARAAEVRVPRRAPQSDLPWLVALLGVLGAVALCFHDMNMGLLFGDPSERWRLAPSIWATVLALVIPWSAALVTPRWFGVALLAGWVGGGAAIFVYYLSFVARLARENGFDLGATPISLFGFTLLALLVVTVLFARTAPGSPARTGAAAD